MPFPVRNAGIPDREYADQKKGDLKYDLRSADDARNVGKHETAEHDHRDEAERNSIQRERPGFLHQQCSASCKPRNRGNDCHSDNPARNPADVLGVLGPDSSLGDQAGPMLRRGDCEGKHDQAGVHKAPEHQKSGYQPEEQRATHRAALHFFSCRQARAHHTLP